MGRSIVLLILICFSCNLNKVIDSEESSSSIDPVFKEVSDSSIDSVKLYQEKYLEFYQKWNINSRNKVLIDSTLYYLNKQIEMNPRDYSLIIEKTIFLMKNNFYDKALLEIQIISEDGPFYKFLEGVISLKLDKDNSGKLLKEAHNEFIEYAKEYEDINDILWKVILDNYFEGKDYALKEIEKYKNKAEDKYQLYLYEEVKELILKMSKEEVLFNFIN